MSIDPRAIADETGVDEEDVLAVLDALDEADADVDDESDEDPPAAPLYELVGMLDDDEADRVRERSREFREEFDERVERTRRELSDQS